MTTPTRRDAYVQFGCGHCAPPGWLNFDASPTLLLERLPLVGRLVRRNAARFPANVRYGDVVRGLPLPDGSCAALYGCHVLEHLALADGRKALANCLRLLRPGGILRVVVPDLENAVRIYLDAQRTEPASAASRLLGAAELGEAARPVRWLSRLADAVGNSRHRWMWDYAALADEVARAGFTRVRRCACGDCDDPRFAEVEDPERFEGAVALEARR
jgi:SAM-dependent methyltransferase